jgi:lipoprotein-anchoring transpeptidase ErfK/SrfK
MLSAAVAATIAAFAFAPGAALAHGDRVSVNDSYMPGTIVIRTGERRLYHFVGAGEAIRYPVGAAPRITPLTSTPPPFHAASG